MVKNFYKKNVPNKKISISLKCSLEMIFVPFVGTIELKVRLCAFIVGFLRSSTSVLIGNRLNFIVLDVMQERGEDSPRFRELIAAYKMHLRTAEDIENEPLVGVWQYDSLISVLIG